LALATHVARKDEGAIVGGERRERRVVELLGDAQLVVLDLEEELRGARASPTRSTRL
jgi:hypothetical protein